ncbi:MAG: prepilin-type N-terminal cleavage/methylation domain-containing protein [Phycisphaerae bacterium]
MANKLPQTGSPSRRIFRGAFTLIEILVVVSIIAILIAILIPALAAAKAESETVACLANQRTIAQSLLMFAHQHNGYMVKGQNNGYAVAGALTTSDGAYMGAPQIWGYGAITNPANSTATGTGSNWDQVLISDKYLTPGVLRDPADTTGNVRYPAAAPPAGNTNPINPALNVPASYRLNSSNQPGDPGSATYPSPIYNAYSLVSITNPQDAIVVCDGGFGASGTIGYQQTPDVATWAPGASGSTADEAISGTPSSGTSGVYNVNPIIHSGKMNVAYLDGHCQTIAWGDTWQLIGSQTVTGYTGLQTAWRLNFSPNYPGQAETINGVSGNE